MLPITLLLLSLLALESASTQLNLENATLLLHPQQHPSFFVNMRNKKKDHPSQGIMRARRHGNDYNHAWGQNRKPWQKTKEENLKLRARIVRLLKKLRESKVGQNRPWIHHGVNHRIKPWEKTKEEKLKQRGRIVRLMKKLKQKVGKNQPWLQHEAFKPRLSHKIKPWQKTKEEKLKKRARLVRLMKKLNYALSN